MYFVFLLHVASTLILVGIVYFVQFVHYPLYKEIGVESFAKYEREHIRRSLGLILTLMIVEIVTAVLLCLKPVRGVTSLQAYGGLFLILLIWQSTWFQQLPAHRLLSSGFDEKQWRVLLTSNWVRIIAWTIRGVLVLWMIHSAVEAALIN